MLLIGTLKLNRYNLKLFINDPCRLLSIYVNVTYRHK